MNFLGPNSSIEDFCSMSFCSSIGTLLSRRNFLAASTWAGSTFFSSSSRLSYMMRWVSPSSMESNKADPSDSHLADTSLGASSSSSQPMYLSSGWRSLLSFCCSKLEIFLIHSTFFLTGQNLSRADKMWLTSLQAAKSMSLSRGVLLILFFTCCS